MNTYPLIFTCREVVVGKRYSASIDIAGRAVLEHDGASWCVYGVEPGAVAGCGDTPQEAYDEFRAAIKSVLIDSAGWSPENFDAFARDVNQFGLDVNQVMLLKWEEARAAIRSGAEIQDDFARALPRRTEDLVPPRVRVLRLDEVNENLPAQLNDLVPNDRLLAAA